MLQANDVVSLTDDLTVQGPEVTWERVVQQAVAGRVSDIHVLAHKDGYGLRCRLDGDLWHQADFSSSFGRHLINHVKALSGMDLAETRRPLEGRMRVEVDQRQVDLRISSLPSLHGIDMVVRLFDRAVNVLGLEELGMRPEQLSVLNDTLDRPSGLILVSGATGSGKTTSLYAMLRRLAGSTRKLMTIEDPVEYDLPDVNQTQVNSRIGVTFATMLKALMRQDPDVIMVGEIRDPETADTAVRAANAGNLVLATTHATRASRSVETLLSLGVNPYFLAASLRAVVAQVLVKRLCDNCRQSLPETADMVIEPELRKRLGADEDGHLCIGTGCEKCYGTGYHGRLGVFELLVPCDDARRMISQGHRALDIDEHCRQDGLLSLEQSAKLAALEGKTTLEEILRVLPTI